MCTAPGHRASQGDEAAGNRPDRPLARGGGSARPPAHPDSSSLRPGQVRFTRASHRPISALWRPLATAVRTPGAVSGLFQGPWRPNRRWAAPWGRRARCCGRAGGGLAARASRGRGAHHAALPMNAVCRSAERRAQRRGWEGRMGLRWRSCSQSPPFWALSSLLLTLRSHWTSTQPPGTSSSPRASPPTSSPAQEPAAPAPANQRHPHAMATALSFSRALAGPAQCSSRLVHAPGPAPALLRPPSAANSSQPPTDARRLAHCLVCRTAAPARAAARARLAVRADAAIKPPQASRQRILRVHTVAALLVSCSMTAGLCLIARQHFLHAAGRSIHPTPPYSALVRLASPLLIRWHAHTSTALVPSRRA